MSLRHGYGLLKCRAIKREQERYDRLSPHYQLLVTDQKVHYRVALNLKSTQAPFDLMAYIDDQFRHPILRKLAPLDFGLHRIPKTERIANRIALDYIRGNLFNPTHMRPIPADKPGPANDLNEWLDFYLHRAFHNPDADLYIFGEPWGPEKQPDAIYGFQPGQGLHNVHMNQGNPNPFQRENGVFQDGALLMHFRDSRQWVAAFFAFQAQSFHTDDHSGQPLEIAVGCEPGARVGAEQTISLRIIAALVNPWGEDYGNETITLINTGSEAIDLNGWLLRDLQKREHRLQGVVESGETYRVRLPGSDIQLGNQGGIITLLTPAGIKVDGVAYIQKAAEVEGQTLLF